MSREKIPMQEWDMDNIYQVIRVRLQELHLLRISYSDVRLANIHASVSVKLSLIDFGISDCTNNEERKKNDFEFLDRILDILDSSGSNINIV